MCEGSHIGHSGIQIAGTDGMAHDLILLKNRFMVLTIGIQFVSVCSASRFFYEILRHIEVFLITGDFIQFCQSHLNDRMTRRNVLLPFIRSEYLTNQIGILDCHIQQCPFSGCPIMSDSRFVEMSAVVQFVAVDLFPAGTAPPTRQTRTFIGNTGRQVTVRFLCCRYDGNHTVEIMIQFRIILYGQRIRSSFDYLVRIGIIKREITLMFSLDHACSQGKVVESAILLAFLESRRNGNRPVCFYTRRPELIVNMYLSKRYFLYRSIRLLINRSRTRPEPGNGYAADKDQNLILHIQPLFYLVMEQCFFRKTAYAQIFLIK